MKVSVLAVGSKQRAKYEVLRRWFDYKVCSSGIQNSQQSSRVTQEAHTHLPQATLLEVVLELLVLQQQRLHGVPQLAHLGLQHELVLPGAAHLLLHRLQFHLNVLQSSEETEHEQLFLRAIYNGGEVGVLQER